MSEATILIIEDNPISRKVLKLSLETENYSVVEAENASIALDKAATQKFDLIIQDLILPDMNGFLLNKKLREIPNVSNIPMFALSGLINSLEDSTKLPGFSAYLIKPINPSYLLDVVRAHLPTFFPSKNLIGRGKHILIADDNVVQLKLFRMQLKNLGFEVTTAIDGVIALKEAINNPPDAIISDILMPNMDGFSLCLEIKRHPQLCSVPVILLTSHYLEDDDLELAKKVGASCYLMRTPDVEKLLFELIKIFKTKSPYTPKVPFKITDDIKEKHTIRTVRQLEQQVMDNSKLAKRCAMLATQLSLIDGIANSLTTSSKDIQETLKEMLYFCLDAIGVSKGALYLKSHNEIKLSQQVGYNIKQESMLESFFNSFPAEFNNFEKNKPIFIPSENFPAKQGKILLEQAKVKFALLLPLFSGTQCLGILFLGSDLNNLWQEINKDFLNTLGTQFGQSLALASVFGKLTSSENKYRQLVEISPDAIIIQQNEKIVYANKAALILLKANSDKKLLYHSFYNFLPLDFQEKLYPYIKNLQNDASLSPIEGKIISLNSEILDVEIVASPFTHQEKPAIYIIMRDITERKRSSLHLEVQYDIAWILAESATLFVATGKILKIICERLGWDCGAIWAVDNDNNQLRCTRAWQLPRIKSDVFQAESQKLIFVPGEGLTGQAWNDQRAIWKSNILNNENFIRKAAATKLGLKTAVAFPIIYEESVLGVIEFFSQNIIEPNSDTLLWFESIGNQLGMFLMRKHLEKQMLHLAEHDILTGLSNRNLLEQYLSAALDIAKKEKKKVAILFMDLDHFKYINDSMGHQYGDLLLKIVSSRLYSCLRPQDTISRLGGDEFIVIISNIQSKNETLVIIKRLQKQLAEKITLNDKEFYISASIGVSFYPDDGSTVESLIKGADIAMYAAKEKGRNNYQFCTTTMTLVAESKGILLNNLRKALENNEFILHYQPKVDIKTKKIVGMEALIRWQKPEGIVLPGAFISAAENSDLIIPICEWVLKTASLQNKTWQDLGLSNITMSVNLSVKNLNKQLLQVIDQILSKHNIKPCFLEVEITEGVLMENIENNLFILRSLKEMGLKISIDDFGTGYSSLSYLKRFPIDTLKIDQSFVRDIATDSDDAVIVIAIIAMAHNLGFKVIAEGVETKEQLKFLCKHNCDEIQGFYFSRPLPANEATLFLKNSLISWNLD